jgi:allantoate deiminase
VIDQAERAIALCRALAKCTEEPGRITRRFLTPPVRDVHALLRERMRQMEMSVHVDAAGNLRGVWMPADGTARRLLIGSHIDTVPNAGAFDGILGVALALECVELACALRVPFAIEVLAFSEEEGVRFGVPFLGSRAVAGCFDRALLACSDSEGATTESALRGFGLNPAQIPSAAASEDAFGFLELHIEQGPVLETENLSVAVVDGIVGQSRLTLEFAGQANHAGTTPMPLRRDALAAAAEWISAVEAYAQETGGLVATVGTIAVEPNAGNVVPGVARLALDVRHANDAVRLTAVSALAARAEAIAARRDQTVTSTVLLDQPAVALDTHLSVLLCNAVEDCGMPQKQMYSGAGHDAMILAARMPAAMLFLRSPGGISHNPAETVRVEDVADSLRVVRAFLQRIAEDNHLHG